MIDLFWIGCYGFRMRYVLSNFLDDIHFDSPCFKLESSVDFRVTKRSLNSIQDDFRSGIVTVDLCVKTDFLILILHHPDSLIDHYSLDFLTPQYILLINITFTL